MDFEFKLPDIGEGLVEGEIVKWFVKEGDPIKEHQPLASVLTDKAEVEIPSPKTGRIAKLFGKPGEKIKVHAPLAVISFTGGESSAPEAAAPASAKPAAQAAAKPGAPARAAAPTPSAAPASRSSGEGNYVFNLPDIGEGLVEGELVKWHVKAGDSVQEHQPIASVLTDKAEVEIPSPKTGKIAILHAKPGEKVKVHSPLVTFSLAGGAAPTSRAGASAAAAPALAAAAVHAPSSAPGTAPSTAAPSRSAARRATDVLATPRVRKMARDAGVDIAEIAGTGPQGRVLEADVRNFSGGQRPAGDWSGVNATPAVKALAAQLGVDLSRVKGTGPGGRVSEPDVRAGAPAAPRAAVPSAAPRQAAPAATPAAPGAIRIARQPDDQVVPFSGIRRKIGERMQSSKRTVAHVTHMDECDMTAVLALRESLKGDAAKRGVKLTFLPFIIRALTKTLEEFPMFNSSLDEEAGEIVVKRRRNIGIAVAAPQGLIVPNVKGADAKDLWALAAEVAALAEKVRAGKIDVASLQDGTFTITNIGPIGGLFATPIVNHPEVAILGLLKMQKRPVVRDEKVVVRDMMNLVLSFDHRVVDGADAANFMNTLIRHLENPRTLL